MANSDESLHQYLQLIRETLYKLIQPNYTATIDEVVWAECFINREWFEEEEQEERMIILREFTKDDWREYASMERFEDGSSPLIATKEVDDGKLVILVGGDGILLLLNDCYQDYIDTHNLHKKFSILIGNEICILAEKCLTLTGLVGQLDQQFGIIFENVNEEV